ncbi:hypothetical protein B296_00046165 [Ensete ventricosum]|uniref:non-specific serine/threonine protein kinase n=1 Tax=Ensete ventricosum TaxID=4639 RepID=A0A426YM42_ENSVE|nr:hypothetical protein B296_00046165 [Ensete ventricosum]
MQTEVNCRSVSRDRNGLSGSSSRSSASVPLTPRTEVDILQSSNLKSFSFSELRAATRNFRPDSVVGEGGFGSVFKGWIDERTLTASKPGSGIVVAVKRLNQEEINYLGQLRHPNLVKLIGYCLEDEHRLLVYEFMPRGSHLTAKSDVYSFGVVLLEMLSGRRAVDKNRPHGEHNLVEWARPYLTHKRKIFRIIDNRLEGQYSLDGAQKVASLAQNCLSMDAKFRPSMDQMVSTLQQLQDTKQTGTPPAAEEKVRARSIGSGDTRASLKDFRGDGSLKVTYPRPSASLLYL